MNAQFGRNINTLTKGIILHYYSSWATDSLHKPAYKFLQKEWLTKFRDNPSADVFQHLIQNPKEAFDENTYITGKEYSEFINSELIRNLLSMKYSTDKADLRLYKFLTKLNQIIKRNYYRIIKMLYPVKALFMGK